MYIEKIIIKNFRSIVNEEIKAKNITVFVGKNDAGKSNILKALNLFFNNQTDLEKNFNFETDYSRYAGVKEHKAKEIEIRLFLSPPDTFKEHSKKIIWIRKWREAGIYTEGEKITFANGAKITDRSRIGTWLKRLQFHYVPAIKSNDYFSELLKKLYATLYSVLKSDLQNAGSDFINEIRRHTDLLSKELLEKLTFESKIQLPEDLSTIFSILDFETQTTGQTISLKHRGDGIKVRHLPVILQFLAEKERIHHAKGAVRSDTIWGYEEPENNLEMFQAFDLANNFEIYSNNIQIFLSTHSPAFYTIGKNQTETVMYNTIKNSVNSFTKFNKIEPNETQEIDHEMGFLPIISPYIKDKLEENLSLINTINELKDETNPVLFVEGLTDKIILENAWKKIMEGKKIPFKIRQAFDRSHLGNTFMRGDIFTNDNKKTFIGMLDFDEAYENWQKLLEQKNNNLKVWEQVENNSQKGLLLKHKKYNGFVFVLPVPVHREKYANQSHGKSSRLCIELLFDDSKLLGFIDEIETTGGGSVKKFKDAKKLKFADLTDSFIKDDFKSFKPIFDIIDKIIKEKKHE